MVRNILRKFFPKFVWKLEKEEYNRNTPSLPDIKFKVPPRNGDTVTILWYVDAGEPPVVDNVLVNGRVIGKDEYDVR